MPKKKTEEEIFREINEQADYVERGFDKIEVTPREYGYYDTRRYARVPYVKRYEDVKISTDYESMAEGLQSI